MFDFGVKRTTRHGGPPTGRAERGEDRRPGGHADPGDGVPRLVAEAGAGHPVRPLYRSPVPTGRPAPGGVPRVSQAGRRPGGPDPESGPVKNPRAAVDRLRHTTGLLLILSGLVHLVVFAADSGPWGRPRLMAQARAVRAPLRGDADRGHLGHVGPAADGARPCCSRSPPTAGPAFAVTSFRHRPAGPAGMPLAVRFGFALLLVAPASGAVMIARWS
ncbi:hypothetical protein ACE1SV_47980 [Streptomyces sp. E-15]